MKEFLKGLKKGLHLFGNNISIIINSILLFFVYFIGVGITSLIAKLFGKHFLNLKTSRKKETYWEDLELKKEKIKNYYRSF